MPCCWEYVCMIVQKAEKQLTSDPSWEDGLCYVIYCNQKQDEGTWLFKHTKSFTKPLYDGCLFLRLLMILPVSPKMLAHSCPTNYNFQVSAEYPRVLHRRHISMLPRFGKAWREGRPELGQRRWWHATLHGHPGGSKTFQWSSIVHVRGPFMTAILNYAEGCHPEKVTVLRRLKMFPWNAEQFPFPPLECQSVAGRSLQSCGAAPASWDPWRHFRFKNVLWSTAVCLTCRVHCVHIYDMRSWYIKALHTQV